MGLIKELLKRLGEISYHAGVAKDYSREIHLDPDKKESIKELDEIIKEVNVIEMYYFSEIKDHVNKLKNELRYSHSDSTGQKEGQREKESGDSDSHSAQGQSKV